MGNTHFMLPTSPVFPRCTLQRLPSQAHILIDTFFPEVDQEVSRESGGLDGTCCTFLGDTRMPIRVLCQM